MAYEAGAAAPVVPLSEFIFEHPAAIVFAMLALNVVLILGFIALITRNKR